MAITYGFIVIKLTGTRLGHAASDTRGSFADTNAPSKKAVAFCVFVAHSAVVDL